MVYFSVFGVSALTLLFIFIAKVIEVSIGTLRIIMLNKGYRVQATLLSFVEIMLWVFIASTVITGMKEAPIKGVIYGLGFSVGVYVGSIVESKLAFGRLLIQVIIDKKSEAAVVNMLRDEKIAVTVLEGEGKDSKKSVLLLFANRKGKDMIVESIGRIDPQAMIVANEVSTLKGGHFTRLRQIAK